MTPRRLLKSWATPPASCPSASLTGVRMLGVERSRPCRLPGRRQALILTLDQHDCLKELETTIEVRPVWEWLTDH
jgi:hypothetical protein